MGQLEKMLAVKDKSQVIGEFLEWLSGSKKVVLCSRHVHGGGCYAAHDCDTHYCSAKLLGYKCSKKWELSCGCPEDALLPYPFDTEKLLAEFFGVDLNEAEKEKRALLAGLKK